MEETTLTERGLSMRNTPEDAARLERKFKSCQKVLTALGDPTRQHLICIMLQQKCSGERVIELARKTNLSRPAISQHMRILKEAGIVKSRKERPTSTTIWTLRWRSWTICFPFLATSGSS